MTKSAKLVITVILVTIVLTSLAIVYVNQSIELKNNIRLKILENVFHKFIEEIIKDIESIRNLKFLQPIEIKLITTNQAIEMWALDEDTEIPQDVKYREVLYKLSLLIPFNKSIIQSEKTWVGMFLAATAGTILYINIDYLDLRNPGVRNVLAHELTHVLQFINFKIEWPRTLDSSLALAALIEGDAGFVQHMYCLKTKLCEPSPPTNIYLDDLYISLNLFPYIYGENFVKYLYEKGGWEFVNNAYRRPPSSTLMVMIPELYIEYLLHNVTLIKNVTISHELNTAPVYIDSLGAYYIMIIIGKHIGIEKAKNIVINLRGDAVHLYRLTNTTHVEWIMIWNTTWSNSTHAQNFYNNITHILSNLGETIYTKELETIIEIDLDNSSTCFYYTNLKEFNVIIKAKYIEKIKS